MFIPFKGINIVSMKIKGTIKQISDKVDRDNGFYYRDVVIEGMTEDDNKPAVYGFQSTKERSDDLVKYNKVGNSVEATFFVNCREHNGRYFTNLNLTYCKTINEAASANDAPADPLKNTLGTGDEDLPF